jgi:hypothetical protein
VASFLSATEQHGRHDVRIAKLADLDLGLGLDPGLDPALEPALDLEGIPSS